MVGSPLGKGQVGYPLPNADIWWSAWTSDLGHPPPRSDIRWWPLKHAGYGTHPIGMLSCFGLLVTSTLGLKARWIILIVYCIARVGWTPQIHL